MLICGRTRIRHDRAPVDNLGTAGCLMVSKETSPRRYLLTASHVVALPAFAPRPGDVIRDCDGNDIGRLAFSTVPDVDRIDAALVELDVECDASIGTLGVPTGWGNLFWDGMAVSSEMGRSGAVSTTVADESVTAVIRYPAAAGTEEVTLRGQVSLAVALESGDSGSVILNPFKNVIGLAIGNSGGHGVCTPIQAVLDALKRSGFDVAPVVNRAGLSQVAPIAAAVTPATAPAPSNVSVRPGVPSGSATPPWSNAVAIPPPTCDDPETGLDTLAWTLWAEAANDFETATASNGTPVREDAFRAVAEVIANRAAKPKRFGNSIEAVCLSHDDKGRYQFSCWIPSGSQITQIRSSKASASDAFAMAKWVARHALSGWIGDLTHNSTHYYSTILPKPPGWAEGHTPVAQVGHHLFFNDVN